MTLIISVIDCFIVFLRLLKINIDRVAYFTKVRQIILLDFARAFDKVQHHLLLDKLALLRVAKQPIQWIENFLMNHT